MTDIFISIVNMSINAAWVIAAVIILRFFLKNVSKKYMMVLWAFVGLRLVCPFTIESMFSLLPSSEVVSNVSSETWEPVIVSGIDSVDNMINPVMQENFMTPGEYSINKIELFFSIAGCVWCVILAYILLYLVCSYLYMKKKTGTKMYYEDKIWLCDDINTPFILGVVKPQIYLPSNISPMQSDYVIKHERMHIKYYDYIWKPLGFVILAIHWFNPFVWVAYMLFGRDMELACDERVIRDMNLENRKDYSRALLEFSAGRRNIAACPLAFGEVGVKQRIRKVLNYRKPAFWAGIVAVAACITVAVCFMTNPVSGVEKSADEIDKEVTPEPDKAENYFSQNAGNNGSETDNGIETISGIETDNGIETISGSETDNAVSWSKFEDVKAYLSGLPDDVDKLIDAGCFVITYGGVTGIDNWNNFSTAVNLGEPAELVCVQYTVEGDALFDYIYYTGTSIYHVCDFTRDKFSAGDIGDKCYEETFNYIKVFDIVEDNGDKVKYIALTDKKNISFKEFEDIVFSDDYSPQNTYVKMVASIICGNENADITGEEAWHDVSYDYDMSKHLSDLKKVYSIVVTAVTMGDMDETREFKATDGAGTYNELLRLYGNLNAKPWEYDDIARSGYAYKMELRNEKGKLLQTVIPYKDAVCIDNKMYDCSKNGTSCQLLMALDALGWKDRQ